MRITCPVSYLLGDTFDEKFAFLAQTGFDAAELSTIDAEGQGDAILAALRRQDVVVSALWGLVNGCTSPDPAKRKEAAKDLRSAFQFAVDCGTRKVVFIDHCLPQRESDATEARKVFLESIASAAEDAERLGVELAVEPLSPRDHALIASTDDGIRLCQEIKSLPCASTSTPTTCRLPVKTRRRASKKAGNI